MTHDDEDPRATQAAVFCVELRRHLEEVDVRASVITEKIRAQMGLREQDRQPDLIGSLQIQLRELLVERRQVIDMLSAIGHGYPCMREGCDRGGR